MGGSRVSRGAAERRNADLFLGCAPLRGSTFYWMAGGLSSAFFMKDRGKARWTSMDRFPSPPYIARKNGENKSLDKDRYQTVFARDQRSMNSAAAPTAGLHFNAAFSLKR